MQPRRSPAAPRQQVERGANAIPELAGRARRIALGSDGVARPVRAWSVLHGCECPSPVLAVAHRQLEAGMRPLLVTPAGVVRLPTAEQPDAQPPERSLLRTWQHVRQWRKVMTEADPGREIEIVHAHSFAAGMAAVRNFPTVVYDVVHFLDDPQLKTADSSAWLVRSFRVAEQFVLARAAAVVVHQRATADIAVQRGAATGDVFVVPEPAEIPADASPDYDWICSLGLAPSSVVTFFAPEFVVTPQTPEEELSAFRAWGGAVGADGVLFVPCEPGAERVISAIAEQPGVAAVAIPLEQTGRALRSADVIIAGLRPATAANAAIHALANRRALLAADNATHRELTPEGRGCLWFKPDDARDLALRAAFLAQHPEFRRALAASGHAHLLETRGPAAIAAQYDAVYRHAFARRREPRMPLPNLQPARVVL